MEYTLDSELEAVKAIFFDEIEVNSNNQLSVFYSDNVCIKLSMDPLGSLSDYEISGPYLSSTFKKQLKDLIQNIVKLQNGNPILYAVVEGILDYCKENLKLDSTRETKILTQLTPTVTQDLASEIEIQSGNCLQDRRSIFQAHIAKISKKEDVNHVLQKLKRNNKIARATHNIYAWRITQLIDNKEFNQHDCECDGEFGAGPKLLRLLEQMKISNTIVIVTRWYGGRHLGPDRFRHINNLAREVINNFCN